MINYGTQNIKPWGWRLSLGLAAAPALLMTVGGLLLPETPNSLIERGRAEEGRRVLERIRGTADVDAEFTDMVEASELANSIEHPFCNILERRNRPQLVMAICMPAFQILLFPVETRSAGQSITVAVNIFFTFVIAQAFLWLLCAFKFGIFLFFACWITVMTVFVHVFLQETKGVPIEEMVLLWRKHWFWKKVMPDMPLEDGWGGGGDAPADNK